MIQKRFHGKAGEEYGFFKLACPHYDTLQRTICNQIQEHYKSSKLKKISVLELGCGPGYTTINILTADKRISVVAVDNEQVMLNQAKTNLADYLSDNRLQLVNADALNYLKKTPSNSVDVFASGFTLHNFEQKYRTDVLTEIFRVLKKGGLFVNADKYAQNDAKEHDKELNWQLKQFNKKYSAIGRADLISEWTKHYMDDNNPKRIMKEFESINSMQRIGYIKTKVVYRKHMDAVLIASK